MAEPLPVYRAKTMWAFMGLGVVLGLAAVLIAAATEPHVGPPSERLVFAAICVRMIGSFYALAVLILRKSPERQHAWAIGDAGCAFWVALTFGSLLVSAIADLSPARHFQVWPSWVGGPLQGLVSIQMFGFASKREIRERQAAVDCGPAVAAERAAQVPKFPLGLGPTGPS